MYVGKRGREGGAFVVVVNCGKRSCVVAVFPAGSSDFVGEPWEVFATRSGVGSLVEKEIMLSGKLFPSLFFREVASFVLKAYVKTFFRGTRFFFFLRIFLKGFFNRLLSLKGTNHTSYAATPTNHTIRRTFLYHFCVLNFLSILLTVFRAQKGVQNENFGPSFFSFEGTVFVPYPRDEKVSRWYI